MRRHFGITSLDHDAPTPRFGGAVVCVDVIRATTTAVTALVLGRRCFPAISIEDAQYLRDDLGDAVLAGELGGHKPDEFELQNSPSQLLSRSDVHRPLVLLSTSGTHLMRAVGALGAAYVACLRNASGTAREVVRAGHRRVDLVGASSRGEFREEDRLCCAWIAERLEAAGYEPDGDETVETYEQWRGAAPDAILSSNSVEYLRRTGQLADLDFVLSHIDDVSNAFGVRAGEVVRV